MGQQSFQAGDVVRLYNTQIAGIQDSDREILLEIDGVDHGGGLHVEFLDPDDKTFLYIKGVIGSVHDEVLVTPGCVSPPIQDYGNGIEQELDKLFD